MCFCSRDGLLEDEECDGIRGLVSVNPGLREVDHYHIIKTYLSY